MTGSRQVTLGETVYTIAPFSTRKVLIAGQMLRKVSATTSKLNRTIIEFRNDYRERNREIVTRAMAALPPWNTALEFMDDAAWERAGGQIELRRDPSGNEIIAEVFPIAFDLAEDEVKRLLALVIIPNQALGAAALAGDAQGVLSSQGDKILDEGTLGQMIELVDVAAAIIQEELASRAGPVGRIRALWFGREATEPEGEKMTESDLPADTSKTNARSSIDSPAPMDGTTEPSSTGSPGAPQSASVS